MEGATFWTYVLPQIQLIGSDDLNTLANQRPSLELSILVQNVASTR